MGRPKAPPSTRYRLVVPDSDASVLEWMNAQSELSMSIRLLIKEDVIRNGFTDVTCRPVGQLPKRGRPSNFEVELRESVLSNDDASDDSIEETPVETIVSSPAKEQESETVVSKPKPEVVKIIDAETGSRQDMITSMFSGGKRPAAQKMSAASMGLLNDD